MCLAPPTGLIKIRIFECFCPVYLNCNIKVIFPVISFPFNGGCGDGGEGGGVVSCGGGGDVGGCGGGGRALVVQ